MTLLHIKRQRPILPDGSMGEVFAVPAMAIQTGEGKKLIPNPAGQEVCHFDSLEAAVDAIQRAGFDYEFEGRRVSTLGSHAFPGSTPPQDLLKAAIPLLINRLQEKEPTVVGNALFALGELRAEEALGPMIAILGHEEGGVRRHLAEALAKFGEKAMASLRKAYEKAQRSKDPNASYIRLTIISTYLEMARTQQWDPVRDALPQILHALEDDNWLVRAQAALVIGQSAFSLQAQQ